MNYDFTLNVWAREEKDTECIGERERMTQYTGEKFKNAIAKTIIKLRIIFTHILYIAYEYADSSSESVQELITINIYYYHTYFLKNVQK